MGATSERKNAVGNRSRVVGAHDGGGRRCEREVDRRLITSPLPHLGLRSGGPHRLADDPDPRRTTLESIFHEYAVAAQGGSGGAVPLRRVRELHVHRVVAERLAEQPNLPRRRDREGALGASETIPEKRAR